jgi:hypothetical protein
MSLGSKQGPTTTQTTNSSLPQHIVDAQIDMHNRVKALTDAYTTNTPNFGVMGMTPDQTMASDLAQQLAMFTSGNIQNNRQITAQNAQAGQANAAQLAPGEIAPFMNPYINNVLDPTLARLLQQQREVQSGIGANAAASHMFGGSREAVMRMLADRNYRQQVGETTGNLLHSGWQQASGLASGNTDRKQAANLTNASLQTQAALANASNNLQAQLGQTQLDNSAVNNQQQAAALLSALGGQQRAIGQQALDLPYTRLQQLISAVNGTQSGTGSSTTTGSTSKPLDIASILLGGAGLLFG